MKPAKTLYPDQDDVWKKAEPVLKDILAQSGTVREAYVWASLAERKFGLYEEPYSGRVGSDVDLVVVMDEPADIPWNYTGVEKAWFYLYELGTFEYQGNSHPVDGLIVIPSRHDLDRVYKALDGRSRRL